MASVAEVAEMDAAAEEERESVDQVPVQADAGVKDVVLESEMGVGVEDGDEDALHNFRDHRSIHTKAKQTRRPQETTNIRALQQGLQ